MNLEQEKILFFSPALSVNVKTLDGRTQSDYRGNHFHKEIELVRVEKGTLVCIVENERFAVKEGCYALIGANVFHRLTGSARFTYLQIDLQPFLDALLPGRNRGLDAFLSQNNAKTFDVFDCASKLGELFCAVSSELERKEEYYELFVKATVFKLIAFLLRNRLLSDNRAFYQQPLAQKILPVVLYAEENYAQKISLESICKLLCMDKFYFCKIFKRLTRATFSDYLNYVRLSHAKRMLLETQDSVSEIVFACGFSSIQYFNKLFKAEVGVSPTQFRKNA